MSNEQYIFFYKVYIFYFTNLITKFALQNIVNLMRGEDLKGCTLYKSRPQDK